MRVAIAIVLSLVATSSSWAAAITPAQWAFYGNYHDDPGTVEFFERNNRAIVGRSFTQPEDFRATLLFDLDQYVADGSDTFLNLWVFHVSPTDPGSNAVDIHLYTGESTIKRSHYWHGDDNYAGTLAWPGQDQGLSINIQQHIDDALAAEERWLAVSLRPAPESFQGNIIYHFSVPESGAGIPQDPETESLSTSTLSEGRWVSTLGGEGEFVWVEAPAVPEPASAALLGLGGLALFARRRR